MKKIVMILLMFIFILTINTVIAENTTDILNEEIYVSTDGSDSLGDGSFDNPYQTLNYTISIAENNSNIYLKNGTYNSTGYEINKTLSISGMGNVTIDALNGKFNHQLFKINENASLFLSNITFINGYSNLDSMILSPIINNGKLIINNSFFNNFTSVHGTIRNNNYLYLNNVVTNNLKSRMSYGEFITNLGYCEIYNTNSSSVFNNDYMIMNNVSFYKFISNNILSNRNINSTIENSKIKILKVSNSNLIINNTIVYDDENYDEYNSLESSNILIINSTFKYDDDEKYLRINYSNVTIISSIFANDILFNSSTVNMLYQMHVLIT